MCGKSRGIDKQKFICYNEKGDDNAKIFEAFLDIYTAFVGGTDVFCAADVSRFHGVRGFARTFQGDNNPRRLSHEPYPDFADGNFGYSCNSRGDFSDCAVHHQDEKERIAQESRAQGRTRSLCVLVKCVLYVYEL